MNEETIIKTTNCQKCNFEIEIVLIRTGDNLKVPNKVNCPGCMSDFNLWVDADSDGEDIDVFLQSPGGGNFGI